MKTNVLRVALLLLSLLVITTNVEAKKKKYPNGDVYEGKWKKGWPEGRGKMTIHNGDWCEGTWHQGKLMTGVFHKVGGWVFNGDWHEEMHKFAGTLTTVSKDVYDGEGSWPSWYDGNGNGTIRYADGAIYEGNWTKLAKDGTGKLTDVSGDIYEGAWRNDKFVNGTCTYASGKKEIGDWEYMALVNGTREYNQNGKHYVETVAKGSVTKTKQILSSGAEYTDDLGGFLKLDAAGSVIKVTGLSSKGVLSIDDVNYYDCRTENDTILFTAEGMDTFSMPYGEPEVMASTLQRYYVANQASIKQQYATQKAKEAERKAREERELAEQRAREAREKGKVYERMLVNQTYKTTNANMGKDGAATLVFNGMGVQLVYSFAFQPNYKVVVTHIANLVASAAQSSFEMRGFKAKFDGTDTYDYIIEDGEVNIGNGRFIANILNNGGALDFSEGEIRGTVVNVKGNKPTVKATPSKGGGWTGRCYRSEKVIFASQKLAKQYDTDMFTVVPTFTIQFDSETEATLTTSIELKKKPYVSLSQSEWDLITQQAKQHSETHKQNYRISNGKLTMGPETFRIVNNGQSLINDSPDFKGTVLKRID